MQAESPQQAAAAPHNSANIDAAAHQNSVKLPSSAMAGKPFGRTAIAQATVRPSQQRVLDSAG
jgi:hypothetical protein